MQKILIVDDEENIRKVIIPDNTRGNYFLNNLTNKGIKNSKAWEPTD